MYGIAGRLNYSADSAEQASPQELIRRMTRLIAYRGPDGDGYYFDRNCGLGHRRLVVIDPASGHQPISNEDRTIWVSFNGKVYNYIEMREELRVRGHRFPTQSDTEVIVHLYEELGPRFVEGINGLFAIVLWTAGSKPCIFRRRAASFLVPRSSACCSIRKSAAALTRNCRGRCSRQWPPVPPAHFLACDGWGVRQEKSWANPPEGDGSRPEEQYAAELLELLTDAASQRSSPWRVSQQGPGPKRRCGAGTDAAAHLLHWFSRKKNSTSCPMRARCRDRTFFAALRDVACGLPAGYGHPQWRRRRRILRRLPELCGFSTARCAVRTEPPEAHHNTDYVSVFRNTGKERVLSREFLAAFRPEPSGRILRDVFARAPHMDVHQAGQANYMRLFRLILCLGLWYQIFIAGLTSGADRAYDKSFA